MSKSPTHKNGWTTDIISPFKFVNNNWYMSNKYKNIHSDFVSIFAQDRELRRSKRIRKYGTFLKEDQVNSNSYEFHSDMQVDNVF